MRAFLVALALTLSACSQPAEPPAPAAPEAPSPGAARAELIDAATPVISAAIGQPVSLAPSTVNMQNDWAWLVAQPQTPSGGEIDWSTTTLADAAAEGMLDGGGTTYVLLKRENGAWRVLDQVIGPTDVAWLDWPARHGAPPELMGLPPA